MVTLLASWTKRNTLSFLEKEERKRLSDTCEKCDVFESVRVSRDADDQQLPDDSMRFSGSWLPPLRCAVLIIRLLVIQSPLSPPSPPSPTSQIIPGRAKLDAMDQITINFS
jgi:hypothetical protein